MSILAVRHFFFHISDYAPLRGGYANVGVRGESKLIAPRPPGRAITPKVLRAASFAEQVRRGKEKIITRNGESYVALVDARPLDHYHRLEREHIHLTLIDEATKGLADIDDGRTISVAEARDSYKKSSKHHR